MPMKELLYILPAVYLSMKCYKYVYMVKRYRIQVEKLTSEII